MSLGQTPSQTVGPYFAYGLTPEQYGYDFRSLFGATLAEPHAPGQHVEIVGQVLDGQGKPVNDAMIEIAQADALGRIPTSAAEVADFGFRGFGRAGTGTDPEHRFVFRTVKPGATGDGTAPHVDLIVFMRGMLSHAFARIWFDDEQAANAADPVLAAVPADRRDTVIAKREALPGGVRYRIDIRMQGPQETVFFEV